MLNRQDLTRLRDQAIADSSLLRKQSEALLESAGATLRAVAAEDYGMRCRVVEMRIEIEDRAARLRVDLGKP